MSPDRKREAKRSSLILDEMTDLELQCTSMLQSLKKTDLEAKKRLSLNSLNRVSMSSLKKHGHDRMSSSSSIKTAMSDRAPSRSVSFADMEPVEREVKLQPKWQMSLDRVLGKPHNLDKTKIPKSPEPSKVGYLQIKLSGQLLYAKRYCVLIDNVLYVLKQITVIFLIGCDCHVCNSN